MGRLVYDGTARLTVDDRELAHLQFVISEKLRRREPFTFTWPNGLEDGGGRMAVWVNAQTPLVFSFDGRAPHSLNPAWLKVLTAAAHSPGGLQLIPEPAPEESERGSSI
jgi:hypothetical protein